MNKIKVDSGELAKVMKTIGRCLDKRSMIPANVQILHDAGRLTICATNGVFIGEMSVPVPGGKGETFCVDGEMFGRVVNLNRGMIDITWDEKNCALKGTGRTRLPILSATVTGPDALSGDAVTVKAEHFKRAHRMVSYAICTDQARPMLTGVYTETDGNEMRLAALDGGQMAVESVPCGGDSLSVTIPGAFMDIVSAAVTAGEELTLVTNGRIIQAKTDHMTLQCSLLQGKYPDFRRVIPQTFATEALVNAEKLLDALKVGVAVNNGLKTIKMIAGDNNLTITNNSAFADYEAKIPCESTGGKISIAFNDQQLMNTVSVLETDDILLKFNTSVSPVIIQAKGESGIHICMPIRLQEAGKE